MSSDRTIRVRHTMSVDVEEWFQVYYGRPQFKPETWDECESKIQPMLETALDLFDKHDVKATFFFVGILAQKRPELVRLVASRGHDIASHGYWHHDYDALSMDKIRKDILDSKKAIEEAVGRRVQGFRAPGYSIRTVNSPILDLVKEAGYTYDSSVLNGQRTSYEIRPMLMEVPPNAIAVGRRFYPVNGGFIFRLLPYGLYKANVRSLEKKGLALNFYVHTWELFTDYPRMPLSLAKSIVQYLNLKRTAPRMDALMTDFKFTSIQEALKA